MAVGAWYAGERITAAKLNLITPTWSSWTPTWNTSTGNATPNIGNGTWNCTYTQTGDLVVANFEVIFGTTTNFGAGVSAADNWQFTLPVAAANTINYIGFSELTNSNGARVGGRLRNISSTIFGIEVSTGRVDLQAVTNTGFVDSVTPWTWASGMAVRGNLMYRAA